MLAACGGGGGGGDDSNDGNDTSNTLPNDPEQGSLALYITDGPADPDLFSSINVTVSQAVLVSDDGVLVPLYNGELTTVDLMNLRHNAIPLSYGEGVPAGRYCEIRLTIDDVELELADGGSAYPDVPAGGILSLIPDDCFDVATDQVVHVELDLDMGKSIYEEGGEYLLRPVFYVNVYPDSSGARLLKLEGVVTEINTVDEQILVCDAVPVYRRDYDGNHAGCAWVQVTDDTGYFNNTAYAGFPRPLSELLDLSMLDEPIAVVGTVDGFNHGYLHLDIPYGQLPPPGECKLWDPDKESGHQPPPESCDYLIDTAPADRVVVDHDGRILLDRRGLMLVNAVAVEHGNFLQVDGDFETAVVDDEFTMNIAPDESVVSVDPFPVLLQEAPVGGNGTRIISKTGELLIADAIDEEEDLTVDAVLINDVVYGAYLRSAIIILDNSGAVVQRLMAQ